MAVDASGEVRMGERSEEREVAGRVTSWPRALGVALVSMLVLVLVFFYVPHWILSVPSVPSRGVRVWLATAWVAAALAGCSHLGWRTSGARDV